MKLQLITLTGPKLQEDIYEVILPTLDGNIAIYPQHMPLVATVVPGVITIRRARTDANNAREIFATNGGVVEITGQSVRLLVDEATHADELVEAEEREALDLAHKLKAEAKDSIEIERAQAVVDRQAVRLKVAGLRRHHGERRIPPTQ